MKDAKILEYAKAKCELWHSSQDMYDYLVDSTTQVITIQDHLVALSKPSIQKDFCFGYGYCGISDQEDMDNAYNCADYASTHEDYFLKENLKDYEQTIQWIEKAKNNEEIVVLHIFSDKIATIEYLSAVEYSYVANNPECKRLGKEDLDILLKAIQQDKAKFEKRLQTYLKRYGLSKLNVWTYLSD